MYLCGGKVLTLYTHSFIPTELEIISQVLGKKLNNEASRAAFEALKAKIRARTAVEGKVEHPDEFVTSVVTDTLPTMSMLVEVFE